MKSHSDANSKERNDFLLLVYSKSLLFAQTQRKQINNKLIEQGNKEFAQI